MLAKSQLFMQFELLILKTKKGKDWEPSSYKLNRGKSTTCLRWQGTKKVMERLFFFFFSPIAFVRGVKAEKIEEEVSWKRMKGEGWHANSEYCVEADVTHGWEYRGKHSSPGRQEQHRGALQSCEDCISGGWRKSKTILKGKVWWILFFLSFFFKGNLKREGLIIFKID